MPCYSPNAMARDRYGDTRFISGHHIRQSLHFKDDIGLTAGTNKAIAYNLSYSNDFRAQEIFPIACKSCVGCRLYYSQDWGIRCMHEAQMYDDNMFLTITYNDENLPSNGYLVKEDMQKFFKRLRRKGFKFRYLYCGEYGDKNQRPHYHAIIFGLDMPDKQIHKHSRGHHLYISEILHQTWGKGYVYIGDVSYQSACYVARYALKKINGPQAEEHYAICDDDGVFIGHKPKEFCHTSNKKQNEEAIGGGLGATWFEEFNKYVYPIDRITMNGKEMTPPIYYDKLLKRSNLELFEQIKAKRLSDSVWRSLNKDEEQSQRRLLQKQTVKFAQIASLHREV